MYLLGIYLFFNWDSLHVRLNSHYEAWSYKKKKHKKIKAYRKSAQKEPTVKRSLLILDLKPLISQVKGKHSIGREFQSLAVRERNLFTQTLFHTWAYGRFIREDQFRREEKANPSILKDGFSSKTDPINFTLTEPFLPDRSKETIQLFPALKSRNHFLPQSTESRRSDSSSEANSSCCHKSEA